MNIRFHSGAEDRFGPFSALLRGSCKRETTWSLFPWLCLFLALPEQCTIYPGIVTSLPATCTVLHPLTKHFCRRVVVLPTWCCRMLSLDQISTFLIDRSYFDQSVTRTCFETFRALRFLSGMSGKLSRQWVEILPIGFLLTKDFLTGLF